MGRTVTGEGEPIRVCSAMSFVTASGCITTRVPWLKIQVNISGKSPTFCTHAAIKVLDKPHLDHTTPIGQGFRAFLSALAEDERQRINKQANEGRKAALQVGRRFGRTPKLTDHQRGRAREMIAQGMKLRAIAREFNVHHSTISKALSADEHPQVERI